MKSLLKTIARKTRILVHTTSKNVLIMDLLKSIAGVFANMFLLTANSQIKVTESIGASYKERVNAMIEYTTGLWFNSYALLSVIIFAVILGEEATLWMIAVSVILSTVMIFIPAITINENVRESAKHLKFKVELFKLDIA